MTRAMRRRTGRSLSRYVPRAASHWRLIGAKYARCGVALDAFLLKSVKGGLAPRVLGVKIERAAVAPGVPGAEIVRAGV